MKKVFGQTVRDIKREVNKKVLKVPGIEQKVLDATSNEAWGPHGTLLADIAQATRNYHEYQMIISVLWKRMSDTGKNWRHVYKALTVLEYLVANGSERVIDDIREHAHQISGLSGFQYIDSSGRDQGSNIRKKSQSLVALVNDKERIIEVRQKAVANREKFRTSSTSGMYRPGSYDDDRNEGRYGSRDDDRNGYGREREWGSRDDERYNRNGESYGQDGDRNGRDNEDHYGRDGYKDDDYRGRSRSSDENQHASRSRSSDRDRDRAYDDDGQYSSRSGVQAGDQSQNGGEQERKFSEQNIGVPPSYEEAVSDSRSPVQSGRDGETASPPAARASPHISDNPSQEAGTSNDDASSAKQIVEPFDEFDPRGSVVTPVSAPAATSSIVEMDLLGSLDAFSSNTLAIMPATPATTPSETNVHANFGSGPTYAATPSASDVAPQAYENPFGDAPFKAIPSIGSEPQLQPSTSTAHFHPAMNQNAEHPQLGTPSAEVGIDFGFGESFSAITYPESNAPAVQTPTNSQFLPQEPSNSQQDIDILADILPPSGPQPVVTSQAPFAPSAGHPAQQNTNYYGGFPSQASTVAPVTTPNTAPQTQAGAMQGAMVLHPQNHPAGGQLGSGNLHSLGGSMSPQYPTGSAAQFNGGNSLQQQGSHLGSQSSLPTMSGAAEQFNNGNFLPQQGSQVGSQSSLQTVSGTAAQFNGGDFLQQQGSQPAFHTTNSTAGQFNNGNSLQQQGSHLGSQSTLQTMGGTGAQHNNHMLGNLHPQPGPKTQMAPQPMLPSSTGPISTVSQPSREKFETKSTVWADTLSRGLVDLNISGAKTNPLADIGVDFEAINRREKRMEKPSNNTTQQVKSTVTMGKAMGSGSGIGRSGANTLRPAANPMMGPGMGGGYGGMPQQMGGMGMGMNMGMNPGMNQGMGMNPGMNQGMGMNPGMNQGMGMNPGMNHGMGMNPGMNQGMGMNPGMNQGMGMNPGMNQGMGMNPGMNQGMGMNPGMGMNMRMGQGAPMQPPNGLPSGGYNPMMGQQPYGGYAQQPYGGGYR